MTFQHSKDTKVLLNELSFTATLNSVQTSFTRGLGEATCFGDTGDKFIPGLASGAVTLGGRWQSGTAVNTELVAAVGVDNGMLVTVGHDGFALAKPVFLINGDLANYEVPASVSETVGFSVEAQGDDASDWGVSLHDLVAVTSTANGSSVDNAASSATGGVGVLHVTAVSGTATPTVTVKIQHSADDSAWSDLITFTAATAVTSQRSAVTGTVNRYLRAIWTVSGTNPSLTFVASFARR